MNILARHVISLSYITSTFVGKLISTLRTTGASANDSNDLMELEHLAVLILTLCCVTFPVLSKSCWFWFWWGRGCGFVEWSEARPLGFGLGLNSSFLQSPQSPSGLYAGISSHSSLYHTLCSFPQCSGSSVGTRQPPSSPIPQSIVAAVCYMAMSSPLH